MVKKLKSGKYIISQHQTRVLGLHICEGCENNTCLINDRLRRGNVEIIKCDRWLQLLRDDDLYLFVDEGHLITIARNDDMIIILVRN